MMLTYNRLAARQRAWLDTAHRIGLHTLDGAQRLFELNALASRAALEGATTRLKSTLAPAPLVEVDALAPSQTLPVVEQVADYGRQVYEIVTSTNGRIVAALNEVARDEQPAGALASTLGAAAAAKPVAAVEQVPAAEQAPAAEPVVAARPESVEPVEAARPAVGARGKAGSRALAATRSAVARTAAAAPAAPRRSSRR